MENRHFFPGKSVLHRPKIGYGFSTKPFQSIDMPIFQAVPAILAKNTPFDGVIRFPYPMRIPTKTSRLSLACLCPQTPHKSLASTSGTTAPNSSLARLKIMLTGTSPSVPEHPSVSRPRITSAKKKPVLLMHECVNKTSADCLPNFGRIPTGSMPTPQIQRKPAMG